MKAITILQPWASLVAEKKKHYETRGWATKYRGPIAIHAGQNVNFLRQFYTQEPFKTALSGAKIRLGYVIAIADLVDCVKVTDWTIGNDLRVQSATLSNGQIIIGDELEFGDYNPGRYAWLLENVRRIDPVPARGRQRLWEWDESAKTCQAIKGKTKN